MLWLFGKKGVHIGASGLILGYIGYMLASAYYFPSAINILAASIVLVYFGGSLLSIFPWGNKNISWQGHLFGLLSGILLVILPRIR
jgi:membrane associated rhomboid family serine protease